MKCRILALILCLLLLCGCAERRSEEAGRSFTDDLGRTVTVPDAPERIAASGTLGEQILFTLCPEKLAGVCDGWEERVFLYLDEAYRELPVLGQMYGGKGGWSPEAVLLSGAELVLDLGEARQTGGGELDAMQERLGIPFVHLNADLETMGETYRRLGELLGLSERAQTLADSCEEILAKTRALSDRVEKKRVLYLMGGESLRAAGRGSIHAQALELLAENPADVGIAAGKGSAVDPEQVMVWDPEVIIFSPNGTGTALSEDPKWSAVPAIRNGACYEIPVGPYDWMGSPPSVQRYLGMLWLGALLYPEEADCELYDEAAEFFRIFYHAELAREQFDALTAPSLG